MTKQTQDKATPRPWTINDWMADHTRLSDTITKLVQERAALVAALERIELASTGNALAPVLRAERCRLIAIETP